MSFLYQIFELGTTSLTGSLMVSFNKQNTKTGLALLFMFLHKWLIPITDWHFALYWVF